MYIAANFSIEEVFIPTWVEWIGIAGEECVAYDVITSKHTKQDGLAIAEFAKKMPLAIASIQQKLVEIDGWLRNRLRYCIWIAAMISGEETREEKMQFDSTWRGALDGLCMEQDEFRIAIGKEAGL
ncbi:MAG: hypothetical protein EOL88_09430 [Bacteroidia bacterium]|nr:hypothetical protein [Bacteroidia bacterium]